MKKTRILVVEDEFIIAHDIQTTLRGMGYDVPVVLSTGDGIVEQVKEIQPDIILMDINLEGSIDGIDAANLIKANSRVPVLYLTSYTDEKTMERAKQSEPFGYIVKPFQQRELRTAIEMAVHKAEIERKLRQSEQWLSTILRSMDSAVIALTNQGKVTFMNPIAELWCGSTQETVQGRAIEDVFHLVQEDQSQPVVPPIREVTVEAKSWTLGNLQVKTNEGEAIPIADSWTPIRDNENKVVGVLFIGRDIREQRKAQLRQQELEAQVQHVQKLESIGVLAGGIAHDFNNLLCIILGNASLALSGLLPDEKVQEKVKLIEVTALRASDLVKQLLSYSGKAQSQMEITHLSALVEEMGILLQTSISKRVTLRYTFGTDLPPLVADAGQLRQVVMNLIINASDAIEDERGTVSVTTGLMQADDGYLSKTILGQDLVAGQYVFFEVKDTGKGMDSTTLGKIFDPFFTTKFTGRGLGLSVVLGIIRTHGGALRVESEVGVGTTFRVLFPIPKIDLADNSFQNQKKLTTARSWKASGTILVVDDEGNVLTITKEILEQEGFDVLTAADGNSGVQLFEEKSSDIAAVVLDMTMPDMTGEETLDKLRNIRSDIKIILVSGYHENEVISRLVAHSITYFLPKPYLPDELIGKVYEALDSDHVRRHTE